jgi:adenine-specific DNA-methyltransferase
MAPRCKKKGRQVADYCHEEATRLNNPPAGLAWQDTEKPTKRTFEYDPHLDPQLVWAGKAERQSFEVEAPSIHVHERLSTDDISSARCEGASTAAVLSTTRVVSRMRGLS